MYDLGGGAGTRGAQGLDVGEVLAWELPAAQGKTQETLPEGSRTSIVELRLPGRPDVLTHV